MIIGSPKEIFKGENRVALTPESAKQLNKLGYSCLLETGAGTNANFSDKDYKNAGVKIVKKYQIYLIFLGAKLDDYWKP